MPALKSQYVSKTDSLFLSVTEEILLKTTKSVRFFIVGDGDERTVIEKRVNLFGVSESNVQTSNFEGKDINANRIQLSSFRNDKYVLLDFWASWCGPCREDFPFLKEMYSKYKDKGFEIINVSRDEKLDSSSRDYFHCCLTLYFLRPLSFEISISFSAIVYNTINLSNGSL